MCKTEELKSLHLINIVHVISYRQGTECLHVKVQV